MKNDLTSYFEDPEFKDILAKYEGMVESHTPVYLDAEDLVDIADYYMSIGYEEEADKVIDYSLQLHPDDTDSLIFRIRSLSYKGKKEEAYKLMDLLEDPTDREVQFLKAELLAEEGRHREAEEVYLELAENEGESLEVLMDIALCYLDVNNQAGTEKWIERIREKGYNEENSQKFRDLWCDYCMTFGFPEEAVSAFQLSLDKSPYSIRHWNALCKCYLAQMEIERAHEAVDFSLAIDENNQEAKEMKAYCYMQGNNSEEAIRMYRDLLTNAEPHNKSRIYGQLGQCYTLCGKMEEALSCYQEWLRECPRLTDYEKSEVYSYIAMCYCNLQRPVEGLRYMDAALDIDPFYCGGIIQKATLHLQLGEVEIGEQLFEKALNLCPEDEKEEALYSIANSYFFLRQYPECIAWCERAMREYPLSVKRGIIMIAYSYAEENNFNKALPYMLQALRMYRKEIQEDPKCSEMLESLIRSLKEKYNYNFNIEDYI